MKDNNDNSTHFAIAMVGIVIIFILVVVTKNFFDSKLEVINTDRSNDYRIPHIHMSDGTIWKTGELISDVDKVVVVKKIGKDTSNMSGKELFVEFGCDGCHGEAGKSKNPMFPALAGKSKNFIIAELKAFQNGTRKNAMMEPNAIKAKGSEARIAEYLASQK